MVNFQDTAQAFSRQSDRELRKAVLLFRFMNRPFLVSSGKWILLMATKLHLPVEWLLKPVLFRHFCGGESLRESHKTIDKLAQSGIGTILDYSVEGKQTESDFIRVTHEVLSIIGMAGQSENMPFAVFKVSGIVRAALLKKATLKETLTLTEEEELEGFRSRVNAICQAAYMADVPVMADAEESWTQPPVDALMAEMMAKYNREKAVVFSTLQMYRTDRLEFLKEAFSKAEKEGYFLGFKLVRGAYLEKERDRAARLGYPSPVHATKSATDRDYDLAAAFCVTNRRRISMVAGTHNEESCLSIVRLMNELHISVHDPAVTFSQLYGMSDHISYNLASEGYNVAKYVPYGPVKAVFPYLIRRAEENTAIAGQTGRELSLLRKEIKRRRDK